MARPTERAGTYRALITWYSLSTAESGAVGVKFVAQLLDYWLVKKNEDGSEEFSWYPYSERDEETSGYINVIKKNGGVNNIGVEQLCHAGWDGDLDTIHNQSWEPIPCQCIVKKVKFEKTDGTEVFSCEASGIYRYDRDPNARSGGVTAEKAQELSTKYGGDLMSAASSFRRPLAPPVQPPPPPKMSTQLQDKPQPIQGANAAQTRAAVAMNDSEIPF